MQKSFQHLSSECLYKKGAYVYRVVVDVFNKYIYGQLAEAFILGSLCLLGWLFFGLNMHFS